MFLHFFVVLCLAPLSFASSKTCHEKDLVDKLKPGIKSIIDTFTPRSVLQEIKNGNCTIYIGSIKINSFGAKDTGHNENVRTEDLENLRHLEYIVDGDVELELSHYPDVKSLSFFANLTYITASNATFSLRNSSVTALFPPSYHIITRKMELIDNKNLCYLEHFKPIFAKQFVERGNKNFTECRLAGAVCHPGCVGCFGPGKELCIECSSGYWRSAGSSTDPKTCEQCDPQCTTCIKPGRNALTCTCKYKKFDKLCVSQCPNGTMDLPKTNHCADCSKQKSVYNVTTKSGFRTCKFCDIMCRGCTGGSSNDCLKCGFYKYFYNKSTKDEFQCVITCPLRSNGYHVDKKTGERICNNNGSRVNVFASVSVLILAAISARRIY